MLRVPVVSTLLLLVGCVNLGPGSQQSARLDPGIMNALMPVLLAEQKSAEVGIAVIRGGRVIWTGFYGEQAPGFRSLLIPTAVPGRIAGMRDESALAARALLLELDEHGGEPRAS